MSGDDTRRDALRRGVALGAAAVAATGVPMLLKVRDALAQSEEDAALLEAAIGLEQSAAVAYGAAVGSDLLDPAATRMAELFRDQEREHADALVAALEEVGGTAPAPPAPEQVDGLRGLGSQAEVLRFAVELETTAVAAYYDAQAELEDAALLRTVASIMANRAQHLVVLRQALGENPSPDAFVTGAS